MSNMKGKISSHRLSKMFPPGGEIALSSLALPNEPFQDEETVANLIVNLIKVTRVKRVLGFIDDGYLQDLIQIKAVSGKHNPPTFDPSADWDLGNIPNLRIVSRNGQIHYFQVIFTRGYFEKYGYLGVRIATKLTREYVAEWISRAGHYTHPDEYTSKINDLIPRLAVIDRQPRINLSMFPSRLRVVLDNGLTLSYVKQSRLVHDTSLEHAFLVKINICGQETAGQLEMLTQDIPLESFVSDKGLSLFGHDITEAILQAMTISHQVAFKITVSKADSWLTERDKILEINEDE